MDEEAKKTVLRMIPYGLYVLTSATAGGKVGAGTINWVTQASFKPPLLAVAVKVDSFVYKVIKESGVFALNVLGKGQGSQAFTFFKPLSVEEGKLSGEPYESGETGSPLLTNLPAYIECRLVGSVEKGDHSVLVGEVVSAGLRQKPAGRPDSATLWLQDLGENIFYGG